jgi:hypothetical protein
MTIEKNPPRGEAVQPVADAQSEKRKLGLKYRYILIAFLAFPGSATLPISCATYAYRQLMASDQGDSDKPKTDPVLQKMESELKPLQGIANAASQP